MPFFFSLLLLLLLVHAVDSEGFTFPFCNEVTSDDVDKHISYVRPYLNTSRKLVHQICKSLCLSLLGIIISLSSSAFAFSSGRTCLYLCIFENHPAFLSEHRFMDVERRSGVFPGKSPVHNETPSPPFLHSRRSWLYPCLLF